MATRELQVPPGEFAVVYVSFNCDYHNRVQILNDQDEIEQEFMSDSVPPGRRKRWESGENDTDEAMTYYIHVEHKNSADYEDETWYESDEKILREQGNPPEPRSWLDLGYEDGSDDDFNDAVVSIAWGSNENHSEFVEEIARTIGGDTLEGGGSGTGV